MMHDMCHGHVSVLGFVSNIRLKKSESYLFLADIYSLHPHFIARRSKVEGDQVLVNAQTSQKLF